MNDQQRSDLWDQLQAVLIETFPGHSPEHYRVATGALIATAEWHVNAAVERAERFAPEVGQRFKHDGVEYVVNRLVPQTARRSNEPARLQIDSMAVEEVVRRRDNLDALLEGRDAFDE